MTDDYNTDVSKRKLVTMSNLVQWRMKSAIWKGTFLAHFDFDQGKNLVQI